ncbi:alpha-1,3/1,6-mannosyltransferase ALG2-like [Cylas formicarius]|uniref:alpha-1,3/1,6-mannosyltransferase ALG2-like n=1 Tax=Cylas formicarius TaxID=197179 RepID=UPI002958DECE|nr:alpha-1,3/1,6-mannosyltransferase ALG2-like [Cylas formicarius]
MEVATREPTAPAVAPKGHVVVLHVGLAKNRGDRYILNLALAYHEIGYRVTVVTDRFSKSETSSYLDGFSDKIEVRFSAWWVPRSLLGLFKSSMAALKAALMAFRVIFSPPEPKPDVVLLDTSMVALCILRVFTKHRLFYVAGFEELRNNDACYEHSRYYPNLLEAKWVKMADEVIVETSGFVEIFKKSYPSVTRRPLVLYPSVDLGLRTEPEMDVRRIIPDLLDNTVIFLSVGKYRRSSNFKLAMDAFEVLLELIHDKPVTQRFQLVIAGDCKSAQENAWYRELRELAKEKICASQITLLKRLPTVHEKTLIAEAAIVIHPAKNDVQSDFVLKAMCLGKPIVATNKGIASKILVNKISGVTTESEAYAVAEVLKKLMVSPHLQVFMGDIARDAFRKSYSFESMCEKLRAIMGRAQGSGAGE